MLTPLSILSLDQGPKWQEPRPTKTKRPRLPPGASGCSSGRSWPGSPRSAGGLRLRDLALEFQRLGRQLGVGGLGEEGVEAAAVVDGAQRRRRDAEARVWPSVSLVSDTSFRFGRKRRLVLLLAWLTLLPTIGLLPVSSQRRAIGPILASGSVGRGVPPPGNRKRPDSRARRRRQGSRAAAFPGGGAAAPRWLPRPARAALQRSRALQRRKEADPAPRRLRKRLLPQAPFPVWGCELGPASRASGLRPRLRRP